MGTVRVAGRVAVTGTVVGTVVVPVGLMHVAPVQQAPPTVAVTG